jgi:hypothetical protein
MAQDPRKRQKQKERKAAKRKEKRQALAREFVAGLGNQLSAATKYPILHSRFSDELWSDGMGSVLLSRELPDRSVVVSLFLVDRYCLGVKNAFAEVLSRSAYDDKYVQTRRPGSALQDVTPAAVRKFVESSVAYAAELGLQPHPDYHKAKLLFGDIDPSACQDEFEFGKDGKPFYVAGPHETSQRIRQIVYTLTHKFGPDGFHFLIPYGNPADFLPDAYPQGQVRLLELPADEDEDEEDEEDEA